MNARQLNPRAFGRRSQRGASMMSVMLGLVIAAVLAAVVYTQFSESQRKARISENTADITSIVAGTKQLFGTTNTLANVTLAVAVQSGAIPDRLRDPGLNTATNKYGGAITIPVAATANLVGIRWANVPRSDCVDLIVGVQGLMRQIAIGANQVKPLDGVINMATASTACDAAATAAIDLSFGRQ
jgi:Tfp pilus assembly protein PilE